MDSTGIFKPFDFHLERILGRNESYDGFKDEHEIFDGLRKKVVDRFQKNEEALTDYAEANMRRMEKVLEQLEMKFKRELKRRSEIDIQKLEFLYDQLCPKGVLQERVQNFAYARMTLGPQLIDQLIEHFHPLDFNLVIFEG